MASELKPRPKTIALINENALFPQLGMDGAAKQAKDLGMKVVYKEKYPSGTKDLSSMLAVIREKNPDILLAAGYTADMILLVKQATEMGVKTQDVRIAVGANLARICKGPGSGSGVYPGTGPVERHHELEKMKCSVIRPRITPGCSSRTSGMNRITILLNLPRLYWFIITPYKKPVWGLRPSKSETPSPIQIS